MTEPNQLQTPKVQIKTEKRTLDDTSAYLTPSISPSYLRLQAPKIEAIDDESSDEHCWPETTPAPAAGYKDAAEKSTPARDNGNDTDSVWEADSSFEVSANLISEISEKYEDDYLGVMNITHTPLTSKSTESPNEKKQLCTPTSGASQSPNPHDAKAHSESISRPAKKVAGPTQARPSKSKVEKRTFTRSSLRPDEQLPITTPKPFVSKRSRANVRKWTESDDDKVAFLREYGNLKWHEVTEFINGRHTPQAVQMRYLRSLKRRNDSLTTEERNKLHQVLVEDYEGRFKRISTQMGPSFTPVRMQKILLEAAGLSDLLRVEKVWTKEEIGKLVDDAAGDFDSFVVPYRSDRLPPRAETHMKLVFSRPYKDLVKFYIGGNANV